MVEFMSNAELDAQMEVADKKKKRFVLSQEDREKNGKIILDILKDKAPKLEWSIVDMPKEFDGKSDDANRKMKDSCIFVKGGFIHPEKGELFAVTPIPINLVPITWLVEDIAEGYKKDYERKMNIV